MTYRPYRNQEARTCIRSSSWLLISDLASSLFLLLGSVLEFFGTKKFSPKGSNSLRREQATYLHFRDILDDIESKSLLEPLLNLDQVCTGFYYRILNSRAHYDGFRMLRGKGKKGFELSLLAPITYYLFELRLFIRNEQEQGQLDIYFDQ